VTVTFSNNWLSRERALEAWVFGLVLSGVALCGGLVAAGYRLERPGIVAILAVLALVAEHESIELTPTIEVTIASLVCVFAAVVLGPLSGAVVAAVGLLRDLPRRDTERPVLRWGTWTSIRVLATVAAGLAATAVDPARRSDFLVLFGAVAAAYAVETGGELLLFDPLSVPAELLERATAVVLTAPYHERDARRLGLPVHTPPADTWEDWVEKFGIDPERVRGMESEDLAWLRAGEGEGHFHGPGDWPFGIQAFPGREDNDLILWLPSIGAIVTGDWPAMPGTSPTRPAARSSGASYSRPSAARVPSRSSSPAPAGSSRASSTPRRCSTRSFSRRRRSSTPMPGPSGCSTARSWL